MTIAKFYRVNGGSTQNVGVIPDIEYPSQYGENEVGERNMSHALLWDEIEALEYDQLNQFSDDITTRLRNQHLARIHDNIRFKFMLDDFDLMKEARAKKEISLQEEKRRALREESESRKEKRKKELELKKQADDDSDLYLTETAFILKDYVQITR